MYNVFVCEKVEEERLTSAEDHQRGILSRLAGKVGKLRSIIRDEMVQLFSVLFVVLSLENFQIATLWTEKTLASIPTVFLSSGMQFCFTAHRSLLKPLHFERMALLYYLLFFVCRQYM